MHHRAKRDLGAMPSCCGFCSVCCRLSFLRSISTSVQSTFRCEILLKSSSDWMVTAATAHGGI